MQALASGPRLGGGGGAGARPRAATAAAAAAAAGGARRHRCCRGTASRSPRLRCHAAAGEVKQLPIFPLNVVALPHAVVPLMIFEARYRVLFNTLLAGAPDVEDGLVQDDSPFAGSRRFGMCYVDDKGRLSAVGTTLEIQDFAREGSGRLFVTNKGVERFRVTKVVQERPVLLCEVEVLAEDDAGGDDARKLAAEVADLFRNVLRLHLKMNRSRAASRGGGGGGGGLGSSSSGSGSGGKSSSSISASSSSSGSSSKAADSGSSSSGGAAAAAAAGAAAAAAGGEGAAAEGSGGGGGGAPASAAAAMMASEEAEEDEGVEAAELTEYTPRQLSYWIAHAFTDSKYTQQALLEEDNTIVRLSAEKELLEATLKYYTAATALEGVFGGASGGGGGAGGGSSSSSSEGVPQPPPGGPD